MIPFLIFFNWEWWMLIYVVITLGADLTIAHLVDIFTKYHYSEEAKRAISDELRESAQKNLVSPFEKLLACTLGPIAEEFLFRGVVLAGLWVFGIWAGVGAMLVSAIIFGAAHATYGNRDVNRVVMALVSIGGILYGLLALTTNSLIPGIIVHAAWNAQALIRRYYKYKKLVVQSSMNDN